MNGVIYDLQRYSLHDGPGIRTVVFLKGCPLRCRWCCNPESQHTQPEPFRKDGKQTVVGRIAEVDEIMNAVQQDEVFFRRGGGVTFSGGEPLLQGTFLLALLKEAKMRRIHAALETCGYGDAAILSAACRALDYLLFDIKSLDSKKHKTFTGVGNELILQNLSRICAEFPALPKRIRTPVIPGFNEDEIEQIADFAGKIPNAVHEKLPYHRFGAPKYAALGRKYPMPEGAE
ncbi:MAG: radical SAM protein [Oscillospiraceae bacterium]|jgi:pyruvate formate lyase activating enzyme|nr:radical SAM protein [Oscillospiraceae bacterium]